jgi:hypothetical protein
LASSVTGVDFVAVPSTDWKRSRAVHVDTLGTRPDDPDGNALMPHHRHTPREQEEADS